MKLFEISQINTDEEIYEMLYKAHPFISAHKAQLSNGNFLYRGRTAALNNTIQIFNVHDHARRPKDTNQEYHELLDSCLENDFGFWYRSYAKFVSSQRSMAADYGKPYAFFPIGENYKFCYSLKVKDPYDRWFDSFTSMLSWVLVIVYKDDKEAMANDLIEYELIDKDEASELINAQSLGSASYMFPEFDEGFKLRGRNKAEKFKKFFIEKIYPAAEYKETDSADELFKYDGEAMVRCSSYLLVNSDFDDWEFGNRVVEIINANF